MLKICSLVEKMRDVLLILLINVEMPSIVGVFAFISSIHFILG